MRKAFYCAFQIPRILKYKLVSSAADIEGNPRIRQPALIGGKGKIVFGSNVNLGYMDSPGYYAGYIYIEARNFGAMIRIGKNVWINNCCSIIAENSEINIGNDTIIGSNAEIINSDFHGLQNSERHTSENESLPINIESNVFIGSNVKILKGVTIGTGAVIANGSVVTKSVSKHTVVGGNPARILRDLHK